MSTYLVTTESGIFQFTAKSLKTALRPEEKGGILVAKQFLPVTDLSGQERLVNVDTIVTFTPVINSNPQGANAQNG